MLAYPSISRMMRMSTPCDVANRRARIADHASASRCDGVAHPLQSAACHRAWARSGAPGGKRLSIWRFRVSVPPSAASTNASRHRADGRVPALNGTRRFSLSFVVAPGKPIWHVSQFQAPILDRCRPRKRRPSRAWPRASRHPADQATTQGVYGTACRFPPVHVETRRAGPVTVAGLRHQRWRGSQ